MRSIFALVVKMHRIVCICLTLLLVLVLQLPARADGDDPLYDLYDSEPFNYLKNYSFERPVLEGHAYSAYPHLWFFEDGGQFKYPPALLINPGRITRAACHGNASVAFTATGNLVSDYVSTATMDLSKRHEASIYAKSSSSSGYATLKITVCQYTSGRTWAGSKSSEVFSLSDTWKKYTFAYNCDNSALTELLMYFEVVPNGSEVCLDKSFFGDPALSYGLPPVTFCAGFDDDALTADIAGGSATATRVGSPVHAAKGKKGGALEVGPSLGWVKYETSGNLVELDKEGSISFWAKFMDWNGTDTSKGFTFMSADYVSDNMGSNTGLFRIFKQSGNAYHSFAAGNMDPNYGDCEIINAAASSDLVGNTWHFYTVTWTGKRMCLYINGALAATKAINKGDYCFTLGDYFYVGGNHWDSFPKSIIDEFTVFETAMDSADVYNLYHSYSEPVGNYLPNHDFELAASISGTSYPDYPQGWSFYYDGGEKNPPVTLNGAARLIDSAAAYQADACVWFTRDGSLLSPLIKMISWLDLTKEYQLSVYASRTSANTARLQLKIIEYDASGNVLNTYQGSPVSLTTEWNKYTLVFNSQHPATAAKWRAEFVADVDTGAKIYLDKAALVSTNAARKFPKVSLYASYDYTFNANISGGNGTAVPTGSPTIVDEGLKGRALRVCRTGTSDNYIKYAVADNINNTAGSLSMWVKYPWNNTTDYQTLASVDTIGQLMFYVYKVPNQCLWFYHPHAADYPYTSAYSWNPDAWHHIVATWNADLIAFYCDGALVAQGMKTATGYPDFNPAQWIRIGGDTFSAGTNAALIDEVYIFEDALTPEQVSALYSTGDGTLPNALNMKWSITAPTSSPSITVFLDISQMYSLKSELKAEINIKNTSGTVVAQKMHLSFSGSTDSETISLSGLPPGNYYIECVIRDRQDNTLAIKTDKFTVLAGLPSNPSLGVSSVVPAPWTNIVLSSNKIYLSQRYDYTNTKQIGFNAYTNILPSSILVNNTEILAGPVKYHVKLAGGTEFDVTTADTTTWLAEQNDHVKFITHRLQNGVTINNTVTIEYDGMMRFDVAVSSEAYIEQFKLIVPYSNSVPPTRFMQTAWSSDFVEPWDQARDVSTLPWTSLYLSPCMWFADTSRGLSWFAGSDRNWVVDAGNPRQKAWYNGSNYEMVISFADTTSASALRSLNFTYGLQAMPVRPERSNWRALYGSAASGYDFYPLYIPSGATTPYGYDSAKLFTNFANEIDPGYPYRTNLVAAFLLPYWNFPRSFFDYDYYTEGVPYATWINAQTEFTTQFMNLYNSPYSRHNIAPYLTPTYCSEFLPEWKFYSSAWTSLPVTRFGEGAYETRVSVANAQWREFWLYSFNKYLADQDFAGLPVRGVFHDMAGCYADKNPLNNMGYERNGVRYPEFPLWELRDLYKRSYTLHRQYYPDAVTLMNVGGYCTPPLHAFADFLLCNERYNATPGGIIYNTTGDGNLAPFTNEVSVPIGPKPCVCGWIAYEDSNPVTTAHEYGLMLLHDMIMWPSCQEYTTTQASLLLRENFGVADDNTIFLPYWENAANYTTDANKETAVMSFYLRADNNQLLGIMVNKRLAVNFSGPVAIHYTNLGITSLSSVTLFDPITAQYVSVGYTDNSPSAGWVTINSVNVNATVYKALWLNKP